MALTAMRSTLALVIAIAIWAGDASASHVVHLPITAALRADTGSGFNVIVMTWDQEGAPNPLRLQWSHSQVPVRGAGLSPLAGAFDYAVSRLGPHARPTGTLSLSTLSQVPTSSEGASSGAALAVGFLAVLNGERLINGIALTGTLEP
ncbi:MAG TPA: hypothetical protein VHF07_07985, partial [Nitrospiraceae bacterium]|nr:hypothetical protein [Nitrospiraceae bacterium]